MNLINLQNIQDRVQKINKELIYHYDYEYFYLDAEERIVKDNNKNEKYGSTRKGYELFKSSPEETGTNVGFSGEVSLREIYLRDTLDVIGYITEKKKPLKPWIIEADTLFEDAYAEVLSLLDIDNDELFKYFFETYHYAGRVDYRRDRVQEQVDKIVKLLELLEEYNSDEDFKKLLDRIIGK